MKIGIITFHASHNYGSMLQAYALQTYLERQGNKVEIINFRTPKQKAIYAKPLSWGSIHQLKQSVKRLLLDPHSVKVISKKWYLFETFLTRNMNLTREYNTIEELEEASFDYDYVITGSDQIWNTKATDFSEAYFATFTKAKKIAYAPSMGPEPETQDAGYVKSLLKDYVAVSVREKRTKDFLETNNIYKPVELVLDPTMLLDAEDYESLCTQDPLIKGKYIFYYTPGGIRPEFMRIAQSIGEKYNLPVITDGTYYPNEMKDFLDIRQYKVVGPSEFLNLVKNAEVVCGASFHLMVFSILFHKNFYCINGDVDSRMNNLMRIMGLEERIISVNNKEKISSLECQYDTSILNKMKKESVKLLNF